MRTANTTTETKRTGEGQSGEALDIGYADLNARKRLVLGTIATQGGAITLGELASICFRSQPAEKRNSWCRNQLRRLVRGGFVEAVASGVYVATTKARAAIRRVA